VKFGLNATKVSPHGKNNHMLDNNAYVEEYAGIEGRDLIARVVRNHPGQVALLSSFGAESSVLLHMVSEVAPDLPIFFLDTQKLFPETIMYRDQLIRELGLSNVKIISPDPADLEIHDADGTLHQRDTDHCCHIRKTLPMARAMAGYSVMISGRKRFHGAAREDLQFVSLQDGTLKVEPLAAFTSLDLSTYMQKHHLPSHPLRLQGYRSIGCVPCTTIGGTDENPRAGRWQGSEKTECGIHFTANGTLVRTVNRTSQVSA
jgi:phosphoadenosine phosphosulfate reductase